MQRRSPRADRESPPRLDPGPRRLLCRSVPRPFPAQTVRDLVGIARLLYRTWHAANPSDSRLPELVAIGKDLRAASALASATKSGTRRHREAWELAELATHRLGSILDAYVAVKPLVASTFRSVDESAEPTEREAKRAARQRR